MKERYGLLKTSPLCGDVSCFITILNELEDAEQKGMKEQQNSSKLPFAKKQEERIIVEVAPPEGRRIIPVGDDEIRKQIGKGHYR